MFVAYKIVAKVAIAIIMVPMHSKVVSPHAHGFIKRTSIYGILDTIVGMTMKISKQECTMLQLDMDIYLVYSLSFFVALSLYMTISLEMVARGGVIRTT